MKVISKIITLFAIMFFTAIALWWGIGLLIRGEYFGGTIYTLGGLVLLFNAWLYTRSES